MQVTNKAVSNIFKYLFIRIASFGNLSDTPLL